MHNVVVSEEVISGLVEQGVSEVCLCAGARNAPLVEALSKFPQLKIHSFVDERSAAFFALGRARSLKKPVIVSCTSGTAVSELLPATIEAFYTRQPLVLLTADRPMSYRGSGAPQCIDQLQLFSGHVDAQFDFESEHVPVPLGDGPVHINLCFPEPLFVETHEKNPSPDKTTSMEDFFSKVKRPLLIVSGLDKSVARALLPKIENLACPMILETTSNLSGEKSLAEYLIPSWSVRVDNFLDHFDGVLRVGAVPTCRLFRDLDLKLSGVPLLQFSEAPFSGVSRLANASVHPLEQLPSEIQRSEASLESLRTLSVDSEHVETLLSKHAKSELNWFLKLKQEISKEALVFLGNSLPIREWDTVLNEACDRDRDVYAQRGVNGIDGLISHFLGMCEPNRENVLVLGDMSFLYDSSALWALRDLGDSYPIKIVVINNSGGRIFRRLFRIPLLEMQHELDMRGLAEYWGLKYLAYESHQSDSFNSSKLPSQCLVEIFVDVPSSDQAWTALKDLYV